MWSLPCKVSEMVFISYITVIRAQRTDIATVKIEHLSFCRSSAYADFSPIDKCYVMDNYILLMCYSI